MFETILFDLDGTLSESHEGVTNCVAYALKAYGIEEKPEDLMHFIGPPLLESFSKCYGFDEETALDAIMKYRERYEPIGIYECRLYPGIKELLLALRAQGKTVAVATSKPEPQAKRVLRFLGIYDCFGEENIFAAPLDERKGSKSAIIGRALAAFAERGLPRSSAVMVGDRLFDIRGGHENGLPVIGVGFGYAPEGELQAEGADYYCETVEDLRRLLTEEYVG